MTDVDRMIDECVAELVKRVERKELLLGSIERVPWWRRLYNRLVGRGPTGSVAIEWIRHDDSPLN